MCIVGAVHRHATGHTWWYWGCVLAKRISLPLGLQGIAPMIIKALEHLALPIESVANNKQSSWHQNDWTKLWGLERQNFHWGNTTVQFGLIEQAIFPLERVWVLSCLIINQKKYSAPFWWHICRYAASHREAWKEHSKKSSTSLSSQPTFR